MMKPTTRLYTLACTKCGHILTNYISDNRASPMKAFHDSGHDEFRGDWSGQDPAKAHDVEFHGDDLTFLKVKLVTLFPGSQEQSPAQREAGIRRQLAAEAKRCLQPGKPKRR